MARANLAMTLIVTPSTFLFPFSFIREGRRNTTALLSFPFPLHFQRKEEPNTCDKGQRWPTLGMTPSNCLPPQFYKR